ncbi:MAG TPA: response regulator transcription factor [Chitinophagales bacterium]|nr:response regulator transcription factor [Chitinophagales bacterium]
MDRKTRILLTEDDPNFGAVLRDYLELNNFDVTLCNNGIVGLNTSQKKDFDLCILDVMMPEMDGFTLASEIRKRTPLVPFIFLTAKTLKADVVKGYKMGADDYITKPFDSDLLLYKIRAIVKRNDEIQPLEELPTEFDIGHYHFNYKLRILKLGDMEQKLSPKEAELLRLMCAHMNDVLPRSVALRAIWGEDNFFTARSMDVFIVKLRKFLKDDPKVEIVNIHSNGYRLVVSA